MTTKIKTIKRRPSWPPWVKWYEQSTLRAAAFVSAEEFYWDHDMRIYVLLDVCSKCCTVDPIRRIKAGINSLRRVV